MSKVFIVFSYWCYEGISSYHANCYEDRVLKVFDIEEKAIEYIRNAKPIACEIKEKTHIVTMHEDGEEWGMFYVGFNVE